MSEMNIQNISALDAQLKAIGFDNLGYTLMKNICLAPASFSIAEKLSHVPESISFIFYFERIEKSENYKLLYYDAVLQQQISFDNLTIGGCNVNVINDSMAKIDWKGFFDFSINKSFNPGEKSSYATEADISQISESLNKLEATEEGKAIVIALKQKFWTGIPYTDLMGAMTNGKGKSEISQRFYFSESQPVISADEAYRFLLNRWMEKQMQLKKKQQNEGSETDKEQTGASSGSSLLRKRRIGNVRKHKPVQE